ncbi:oligosaccharide flippase family protein [Lacticaseibacillus saniviri]|uniref:Uncharacterized protein n=1 Tax=Lacticaseibacillus saniviri JCM 17471 = DSM 24301 TaxID=1293598 RepID=A0A0R2MQX0_9LACO|nr:oligosaccharide flippase family protein [Lacticaseibacillus saniviri]KRO16005.1 hypothetical protein IV56_GL002004 [Lacticaseibacillus saniviri JCM 17471 = DSM 24301]MCG4281263.1 oligosaccharide flippase family protein [Lacticaseibacillus saniviri]
MRKTFTNIIYNGLYQLVILILPIITVPYVSVHLGKEAIGVNAYVNAIPVFLSVIILFGMNQFGARTIAQAKKDELPAKLGQLWLIQLVVGLITIGLFVVAVFTSLPYKGYFLLEVPFLLGYILDVSWFFIGLGEIKRVVLRNTVIKLAILASIFIFVHKPEDLWIYLLINSITYLANIIFWFDLPHFVDMKAVFSHLKWNKQYFMAALSITLPSIAVQFYISFDQTIVGMLAGNVQLAYYQQSQLMVRSIITMVGSISTILMPKMAQMLTAENGQAEVIKMMKTVLDYSLLVGAYFTAAFMVNAQKFVVWFWTKSFAPMGPVLWISALIIMIVSYGSVYANQYTLSRGLFRRYAMPFYVGAVVSVSLNLLVVGKYRAIGAAVVILITELVVCALRVWVVRDELPLATYFSNQWKILVAAVITVLVMAVIPINFGHLFIQLVVQTILLTVIYLAVLMGLREQAMRGLLDRFIRRRA